MDADADEADKVEEGDRVEEEDEVCARRKVKSIRLRKIILSYKV